MNILLKSIFLGAMLLFDVFACRAQAPELDKKYGFRDLSFGRDVSTISGLIPAMSSLEHTWFTRPTDKLQIGDAPLTSIRYRFYKNRFYTVEITAPYSSDSPLLKALQAAYGSGYQYEFYKNVAWEANGSRAVITYKEDKTAGTVKVEMWSSEVGAQMEYDTKEAAKAKAKADL